MPGDHVNTFDNYSTVTCLLAVNPACLAFIFAGYYEDIVAFLYAHQTTSGARDTILMNPLSLNSRATGPNIRVPLGSRFS